MIADNRFIELAKQYPDNEIPLDRVFEGAAVSESDQIIEAMYLIADRRSNSGQPIGIIEIADSIPDLVAERSVLDAVIDICLKELTASGLSREDAYETLLDSTSPTLTTTNIKNTEEISTILRQSIDQVQPVRMKLPAMFGRPGLDGQPRYELRRILGSGKQGTIYETIDRIFEEEGLPSLVALKVFHADSDPDQSLSEGSRARRIRHKNIARVIDQGQSQDNQSYLVYELIEGQPLDAWIKQLRTPLDPKQACQMIIDLARGIQTAHNAGVIHRDLKPSNILMNRQSEPIITDFGIAHCSITDPTLSSHYGARGSLAFMAPEQFDGSADGSMPSVDIYALGGILYWLLIGQFPNGNTVAEALAWLGQQDQSEPPQHLKWGIDTRLKAVIERALSIDPAVRYQSAEALAIELEDYLADRPIPGIDEQVWTKAKLFSKRNPMVVLLNVAVIILIGVATGIWVNAQDDIRLKESEHQASLELEKVNGVLAVEQERIVRMKEKAHTIRTMLQGWTDSAASFKDPEYVLVNLNFLETLIVSNVFQDDEEFVEQALFLRIEAAESYLAVVDQETLSPIQLALLHELLGIWYAEDDSVKSNEHLDKARALAQAFAPEDHIWIQRLAKLKSNE